VSQETTVTGKPFGSHVLAVMHTIAVRLDGEKVASYAKLEVSYILQHNQKMTKLWPEATCTEYMVRCPEI